MTRKNRRSRGGRPKNPPRPKIDEGTPQLKEKRMLISPKDTTLATNPLDVLKARGIISDEAYAAAGYFAALRKIVFGKAIPPAIDIHAISAPGAPDELDDAKAERRYREACSAMSRMSRGALDAVENVAVHERWPAWMFAPRGASRGTDRRKFSEGLAALLAWYKGERRATRVVAAE